MTVGHGQVIEPLFYGFNDFSMMYYGGRKSNIMNEIKVSIIPSGARTSVGYNAHQTIYGFFSVLKPIEPLVKLADWLNF